MITRRLEKIFLQWAPRGSHFISLKVIVDGPTLRDVEAVAPPDSPALARVPEELRVALAREVPGLWENTFLQHLPFGDHYFVHCTISADHRRIDTFNSTLLDPECYWAEVREQEQAIARSLRARTRRKAKKQQP